MAFIEKIRSSFAAAEKEKRRKSILDYSFSQSRVLYKNDFESGLNGWMARGPDKEHFDYGKYLIVTELTGEEAHSGKQCMKVSGRIKSWNGAILDITDYIRNDITEYESMVWVKLRDDADPCMINLSLQLVSKISGIDFPEYRLWEDYTNFSPYILSNYRLPVSAAGSAAEKWEVNYQEGYSTDDGWVLLRGKTSIQKSDYESVSVYIETSNGKTNTQEIYIDDFVLLIGKSAV